MDSSMFGKFRIFDYSSVYARRQIALAEGCRAGLHFIAPPFVAAGKETALFRVTAKSAGAGRGNRVGVGDPAACGPFGFISDRYAVVSPDAFPIFETKLPDVF